MMMMLIMIIGDDDDGDDDDDDNDDDDADLDHERGEDNDGGDDDQCQEVVYSLHFGQIESIMLIFCCISFKQVFNFLNKQTIFFIFNFDKAKLEEFK